MVMAIFLLSTSALLPTRSTYRPPAYRPPAYRPPAYRPPRCCSPTLAEADDVAGAVSGTFGDLFKSMFKPSAEKEAAIDRAYAEQLEVAARRKNPTAYRAGIAKTEENRKKASDAFKDKFAWQASADPLAEFKKRRADGRIKDLGYNEVPKGGIQMPMASFGVGGEFGVGGKMDNGERFDLRLPYADRGWEDPKAALGSVFGFGRGRDESSTAEERLQRKKASRAEGVLQGRFKGAPPFTGKKGGRVKSGKEPQQPEPAPGDWFDKMWK